MWTQTDQSNSMCTYDMKALCTLYARSTEMNHHWPRGKIADYLFNCDKAYAALYVQINARLFDQHYLQNQEIEHLLT